MAGPAEHVIDLIFGRWRSQILYAGAAVGVFDHLNDREAIGASAVGLKVGADPALLYRLLRAIASIGLLTEDDDHRFRLTEAGALLREDHPHSLRAMALLEEGPEHYAVWRHLVPILRDGSHQDGFQREFGAKLFEYARSNPSYGAVFNRAMSSYSAVETDLVAATLTEADFTGAANFCDVAGGHGHLACGLLRAHPQLRGIVFDMPEVVSETDQLWAPKLGLADRCQYIGGDMFREVPESDTYVMKKVLHDWTDAECIAILVNIRRAAKTGCRFFNTEFVIPGPAEPHFAKLFDVHMFCALTGRERTAAEHAALLAKAGWRYELTRPAAHGPLSVIVATAV
jgi:O-methyltransferase domain/Dimerisation domain